MKIILENACSKEMKMILEDFRSIRVMEKDKKFLRIIYNNFKFTEEVVSVEELTKIPN